MDKKIIALTVAAVTASSVANAAEVYSADGTSLSIGGRAEFRGDFIGKSSGAELEGTMDNNSRFRLNVGGDTKVTEQLSGFAFYEAEQGVTSSTSDSVTDDNFKQRYMYVGLQGNFGALSFGRQDTAAVQISQMSDVTTHTGAQKAFISASNEQINNTILYTGDFDSFIVKASYVAGSDEDTDGFGISGIYTLPMGLGLGLGYSADGEATAATSTDSGNAIIAGINYSMDALYLAATYTTGDSGKYNDEEFNGMEFAAVYKLDSGLAIIGAYQKTEYDDGNVRDGDASDWFEVTGDYKFNSNLNSYITFKLNNIDDADNSLRLGLKYAF